MSDHAIGPTDPVTLGLGVDPPEALHDLGMAIATLEAAVMNEPDAFRVNVDHAHVIGDALVFALAMKGFVIRRDPGLAAIVAAEYERSPEQAPKLQ